MNVQALTTVAEVSFDTLRKTFTFPAGPLERNPHSSTPHLAYNAQNSVVYAYENASSELLAKLDAVDSKSVRNARKELVVQTERGLGELEKKVIRALGVDEEEEVEEKVEETCYGRRDRAGQGFPSVIDTSRNDRRRTQRTRESDRGRRLVADQS